MDRGMETHREDILEAIVEAAQNANVRDFEIFYQEWQRIDQGENQIRLSGMPIPYLAHGFCFHCGENWGIEGVAFNSEDTITEADCLEIHVTMGQCKQASLCCCFMAYDVSVPQCQLCHHPFETCLCGDPAPGPCLSPIVTLQWLR